MTRTLGIASLCAALGCATSGSALAQAYSPPMERPAMRYALPWAASGSPLYEGRSVYQFDRRTFYRMDEPAAFYNETDETGYRRGPENPQTSE